MGEIKVVHVGPGVGWGTKEEQAEAEKKSKAFWEGLDDERRAAMLLIAREALARLIEVPEIWVPISIEPKTDERVDLYISVHMSDVDEEVVKRKLEAERNLHEATQGVLAIERGLRTAAVED